MSASFSPHRFHILAGLADRDLHGAGIVRDVLDRSGGELRLWPRPFRQRHREGMARTPEELGRPRGDVDPGYGVLSYAVSRRTRELGVRMALGQSPGEVRRTVPRRGMALLGAAAVLGMAGTALLARTAEQLFGVMEPLDPVTCLLTTVVLLGVAAVACWLPARRATRVDPTAALRA